MNMREILDITNDLPEKTHGRSEEVYISIGKEIKELLQHVNLDVIGSADLASHVLTTIRRAYLRQGASRNQDIADMYGQDNREEDLGLGEMAAKVEKLQAEASKINRS